MPDVVQIDPSVSPLFGGCFGIVRQQRPWGLVVDIIGPMLTLRAESGERAPAIYPFRVANGKFRYVGKTEWTSDAPRPKA